MGLFDDIAGKVMGGAGAGEGRQGIVAAILEMLSNRQGGIMGLVAAFRQNGMGDIVSSWIGTGPNAPVSADQVRQALGNDEVQAFAAKSGLSPDTAGARLAELLPGIVDRLTPGGEVPQGGDLMSRGMGLLQGFMSGGKQGSG